ncbi:hypothetical protein B0A79_15735 [Flavobacterium piscis]|uniref:DUF4025 domain-containing protein n=2 Tax=Flavobacterium piscis TaxID=1114874 RepID=A0ABX2XPR0_9FLAO|nr:hypothetical protein FLP_00685 [Flavobacterium piscis]OXG02398.1 hypothetical protein B0A79_15735 [Flavobacterium piscis]
METNKNTSEEDQQTTNENANSAYSSSGSMQPGEGTGEAGRLNDYQKDYLDDALDKKNNSEGKSITEATDPSKLSDI